MLWLNEIKFWLVEEKEENAHLSRNWDLGCKNTNCLMEFYIIIEFTEIMFYGNLVHRKPRVFCKLELDLPGVPLPE